MIRAALVAPLLAEGVRDAGPSAGSCAKGWRARPFVSRGLTLGLLLTIACADLFGPDPIVKPPLSTISLTMNLQFGGLVHVDGFPSDTSFRLRSDQRVPIELAVSSGDRESAGLYRYMCPERERGPGFTCFEFDLAMRDGFHAADLAQYVEGNGGRFNLISVSGRFASVTLFDPTDLVRRARRARDWPGVAYTTLLSPECAPDAPGCVSRSHLRIPLAFDTGSALTGDGIVQGRSGDTVIVRYHQPAGGVLEARRVVHSVP